MNELQVTAAVLAEARGNADLAEDLVWFRDTVARVQVRYGRALAALAEVPALVAEANRWQVPEAAWNEAEALNTAVRRAVEELEQVGEYLEAVLDPGPVSCQTCGGQLGNFLGAVGWQHWRSAPDPEARSGRYMELVDADHEPDPLFARPNRPAWSGEEPDEVLNGGEHQ